MTMSKTASFILVLFAAAAVEVQGRFLRDISGSELVSDGVDDAKPDKNNYLLLKGIEFESSEKECKQMYGFLPCSSSIFGHLFLILVYEYLLFYGESFLASGGEQIFKILGPGIFGASAFDLLGALPESLILLVSGLLSTNKETAQDYAYTGVGLLAGSSILLLTVVWGTCVIAGSKKYETHSNFTVTDVADSAYTRLKSFLTGSGITTDLETSYIARIMVFSITPLLIMQIPSFFHFSFGLRSAILIVALIITVIFLFLYFIYQVFQPWIQKRRLEFVKHDHVILKIIEHVQKHTLQRILTKNGTPNVRAIRRIFREINQDGDSGITASEVKRLLFENRLNEIDATEEKEIQKILEIFDMNDDKKINKEEFVYGFTKWLEQTKYAVKKEYLRRDSLKKVYKAFEPWIQNKRKERENQQHLISEILSYVQSDLVGSLLSEDGHPNEIAIKRLFEKIDRDGDSYISQSELKELLKNIKFVKVSLDVEEAVATVIEELDINQDHVISEEEFVDGIERWLNSLSGDASISKSESQEAIFETWEKADMVVEEEQGEGVIDKSTWAWFKAILYVVLGIALLSVLAEPLIESVHSLSEGAGIHPFFVSFILVPLATSAREATSAVKEARKKKTRTTSLAISEIYGGVFMNNVLGFFAVSVLIYVRQIRWEFSAEALVVAIACAVMGLKASFCSTVPLWMAIFAFLLYPLSLVLVYALNKILI
ncbi:hypothetical protein L6164_022634 [Bauhinia variegata]|uniref:Uncharacterized protein n=1 Tax=Bauhinia variegata TaxID=167791 RepID=A0ACB9MFV4_BAUVA|nr:hypothetical protein L6164_022634 [Bauhinia variegata]